LTNARPIVAVVDDDPTVLEALEELLESSGYETLCFSSCRELLAKGLPHLDVLITDIGMPGMDGFDLRDLVRKEHPALPVFLITGRHELAEQGRARGIGSLFRKPFDAQNLLVAIGEALKRPGEGE
jgi:FixJ family two-component response regulator